ncbi:MULTISPECIES: ABC transporter ATP-binding protein [Priestia]|jgi:dipeptide transport system ATP-binding protein|uniref:Dipeptide ABC transporter, ATP-binding protein DppD n=1 Tax=Priestia megaterium (strain ATCC 12872 / QMB1551) TaxID=545693 RepID=D5E1F9_PRIM1|nr:MULTISPECIES: ABC transporter ATP-binding protein [Priestia]AVX07551.1 ABC transporter ATP-binding protein [Bacillus sp. Y-01]KRF53374.1 peptide ABC transporter ATP-binding protein [Bacillus sp. Soil531]MBZ5479001.1 ABC transporter ATP-binding protein [Bacillus sp. T_4]MCF6795330.1 ABC transporter ATP-binding protein [Bacillus sp. ET1]MDH6655603.1 dipeptide transport system ATP-binding protein [Bacillus sp. PvP124]MDP9574247.1 dipeptide transport system ATP-binding protein [Bacillus sp. 17
MEKMIQIKNLHVQFSTYGGRVQAVRGVSFDLHKGETLAIVGESGCGKSVTSQSIMRLIPTPPGRITSGSILFKGQDLTKLSEKKMRDIRGADISMIFQDPMTALNPTLRVGEQIAENIMQHENISKEKAKEKAFEMLELVGIPNPKERLKQYPHEFSGGMRQRIVIAMALVCNPEVLIADEPTTALDVTIQAQILELFKDIQQKTDVSIVLITHDLGVVAQVADRVAVMYAGKIVEIGTRRDIFYTPQHPYTKGLLRSVPRLDLYESELVPIAGSPPDLFAPPSGCSFAPRCPYVMEVCDRMYPASTKLKESHQVHCWLQDERAQKFVATIS